MGYATTSWADLVDENDGIKIMELVGLFLGLLATCFCWQLCSIASTSNADGLQQPLHPGSTDMQPISDQNEPTERAHNDSDSAFEDHATGTDTQDTIQIYRTEETV